MKNIPLDEKDSAILAQRQAAILQEKRMKQGDFIRFADGVVREWDIDGTKREAIIHYPAKADREHAIKSPVILAFHGHGGRAARVPSD